jgi:predicted RNA-binding Zn-ribbon protein involved in translation (DUF1610 family)
VSEKVSEEALRLHFYTELRDTLSLEIYDTEHTGEFDEAGVRVYDWDRAQRLRDIRDWVEGAVEKARESLSRAESRYSTGEAVMPRVGGKSFRCECGANVFTKWVCEEHQTDEYKCNACGTVYAGVPL